MDEISLKEFVNTFYKDIYRLLSEKFKRIGTRKKKVFEEQVERVFRQTAKSRKVFETIANETCLPECEIMLLLECSVEVTHKIYMDNAKLQGKKREILRKNLHEEHTRSREKSNTISKKESVIKKQERIVKQLNRTIDQIRQDKKTGRNKENDQQKKPKKGRSSNGKKWEEILEIPVLLAIAEDDPEMSRARDLFFYDIPNYWSEEEVRTNLSKIRRVIRIQIRGQHKYKTVKAKLILNENFEKTFKEGYFRICISKHFIR